MRAQYVDSSTSSSSSCCVLLSFLTRARPVNVCDRLTGGKVSVFNVQRFKGDVVWSTRKKNVHMSGHTLRTCLFIAYDQPTRDDGSQRSA